MQIRLLLLFLNPVHSFSVVGWHHASFLQQYTCTVHQIQGYHIMEWITQ